MMAVLFEVEPAEGQREVYLGLAAQLAGELVQLDGFISIERFQSLKDPGKLLSLSFWRDEAAVKAWRDQPAHREAQRLGRNGVFAGYRLRVVSVVRDYGLSDRVGVPADFPSP